jgi:hypothetical protein
MRKYLLIIPVFVLLLSSCNFPLFQSANNSDLVATKVALTLQASENTVTSTPGLNATIIVVTETPSATTTATITPTATPADPKLTLGTPVYADTFSSGGAFGLKTPYSDDAVVMTVENGNLVMASTRTYGGTRWRLSYLTPRNYYLEGTFKTIDCSGDDYYGLVMRSPDYGSGRGYYFGVSCRGEYYFMQSNGADDHILVDWTSDPAILSGTNQENRLGVMLKDEHFSLYINGKLVKELDNGAINAPGYFGVFISAIERPTMTVNVEEINQWNLP